MPGCALDFGLSRVSGRSIARERYLNRRLRPIDPYGTGFQKSTLHNLDFISKRTIDTTFSNYILTRDVCDSKKTRSSKRGEVVPVVSAHSKISMIARSLARATIEERVET